MYKYIFIYIRNNLNRIFKRYIPISCIICYISCFSLPSFFQKNSWSGQRWRQKWYNSHLCPNLWELYDILKLWWFPRSLECWRLQTRSCHAGRFFIFQISITYWTILLCTCFANMKCLKFRIISIFSSFLSKFRITNLQIRQNWNEFKTPEVPWWFNVSTVH